jgi:hypothetical protein
MNFSESETSEYISHSFGGQKWLKDYHIKNKTKYMVRFRRGNSWFERNTNGEMPSIAIQRALSHTTMLSRSCGNSGVCVYKFNPDHHESSIGTTFCSGYFVSEYEDSEKISEDEYGLSPEEWFNKTGILITDRIPLKGSFRPRTFKCFWTEGGRFIDRLGGNEKYV